MPRIVKNGLYLSRHGREVGIVGPAGTPSSSRWRWLTTRGYYVTADGRAAIVGECSDDLVKDITPTDDQVAALDSQIGLLR